MSFHEPLRTTDLNRNGTVAPHGLSFFSRSLTRLPRHCLFVQSVARNFSGLSKAVPSFLNVVDMAHGLVGPKPLEAVSGALNKATGRMVPVWNPYMPKGSTKLPGSYMPMILDNRA